MPIFQKGVQVTRNVLPMLQNIDNGMSWTEMRTSTVNLTYNTWVTVLSNLGTLGTGIYIMNVSWDTQSGSQAVGDWQSQTSFTLRPDNTNFENNIIPLLTTTYAAAFEETQFQSGLPSYDTRWYYKLNPGWRFVTSDGTFTGGTYPLSFDGDFWTGYLWEGRTVSGASTSHNGDTSVVLQKFISAGNPTRFHGSTGMWGYNGGLGNSQADFSYFLRRTDYNHVSGIGSNGERLYWRVHIGSDEGASTVNTGSNPAPIQLYWHNATGGNSQIAATIKFMRIINGYS